MSEPLEQPTFQPPPPPQTLAEPPAKRPTQLRPFAIGSFVLGLIVLGGGLARFIPGGINTGIALACLGLAMFGVSFVPLPRVPDTEPPLPPVQKLLGIFYEPTRVFRNLRVHPRWLAALILVTALGVIYSAVFVQRLTAERIVNYRVDKVAEMGPPFAPSAERLEQMRADGVDELKNPIRRAGTVVSTFAIVFIWGAVVSALYLVATLAFGGRINFWQAFAVYFYSALPVAVVQKVLSLLILYLKSPDDIHPLRGMETVVQDNLGVLFSPGSNPVLFVIASQIGVLAFYSLWLKAKGLQLGGTRVSSGAAWGVTITFWVVWLVSVTILASLFPGFIG